MPEEEKPGPFSHSGLLYEERAGPLLQRPVLFKAFYNDFKNESLLSVAFDVIFTARFCLRHNFRRYFITASIRQCAPEFGLL